MRREKIVLRFSLVGLRHFIRMRRFERKWRILIKTAQKKDCANFEDCAICVENSAVFKNGAEMIFLVEKLLVPTC